MADYSGRCLCGAVSWSAAGPVTRNLICHCEHCQRATSSPFAAFVGFDPDLMRWSGEVNHYQSSPGCRRGFCPTCGSRLYFRSDKWPGEIHLHAGTLDHPERYAPDAQVCLSSRRSWLDALDGLPRHQGFQAAPQHIDKPKTGKE